MSWANQPEWWAIIIAFLIGLGGIFRELLVTKVYKPTLEFINFFTTEQGDDLKVLRLELKNTGSKFAEDVEASLVEFIDNKIKREPLISLPLHWTHDWIKGHEIHVRNIYPGQSCFLDIANMYIDSGMVHLRLSMIAGQENPIWSQLNIGISRIQVLFFDKQGYKNRATLEIRWDGSFSSPTLRIIYDS